MATKGSSDGEVHAHFSPYDSPHEAYVTFMNVVDDLARRIDLPPPSRDAALPDASDASAPDEDTESQEP